MDKNKITIYVHIRFHDWAKSQSAAYLDLVIISLSAFTFSLLLVVARAVIKNGLQ